MQNDRQSVTKRTRYQDSQAVIQKTTRNLKNQ